MTSLHGPQDRRKKSKRILSKPPDSDPWHKRGLSRADRVIAFLEMLPITKGILVGKKMKLLPGQRKFVKAIYGRLSKDGRRKIRLAIKSEPRGNGKTGLLAGLALCHLLGPECEARGEMLFSAAYNKLQAALIFAEMKAIVEAVPDFARALQYSKIRENHRSHGGRRRRQRLREPIAPMTSARTDLSPTLWIYDEFAQAPNTDLLDNLRTAMGKRSESLGVIISTQAANDQHPLSQMIDDARSMSIRLSICSSPPRRTMPTSSTRRPGSPAMKRSANSSIWTNFVRRRRKRSGCRAFAPSLKTCGSTDGSTPTCNSFPTPTGWQCAGPLDMRHSPASPAMRASICRTTTDMSALVPVLAAQRRRAAIFWLPAEGLLDRDRKEGGHYRTWRDAGLLETTPGKAINFKAIIQRLAEISTRIRFEGASPTIAPSSRPSRRNATSWASSYRSRSSARATCP